MIRPHRYVPREANGRFAHYLPILEERPGVSHSLRAFLCFTSGFIVGVAIVVLFYFACLFERAAEATQGPENGATESMNTMDVNVQGVKGFLRTARQASNPFTLENSSQGQEFLRK